MSKTKTDKKVNRKVKAFNKALKKDVFKDRFWVRQYQKTKCDGLNYYLYELVDNLEPERNTVLRGWILGESCLFMSEIWEGMNDFIIKSDFWSKYYNDDTRYNIEMDTYRNSIKRW